MSRTVSFTCGKLKNCVYADGHVFVGREHGKQRKKQSLDDFLQKNPHPGSVYEYHGLSDPRNKTVWYATPAQLREAILAEAEKVDKIPIIGQAAMSRRDAQTDGAEDLAEQAAEEAARESKMTEDVCGFYTAMVDHELNVLMIEKLKPEWQKGKLNGVGGKVEPNELVLEAMAREFAEEAGKVGAAWEVRVTLVVPGKAKIHFCLARGESFALPPACNEGSFEWVAVSRLYEHTTIPNLRWLVPLCLDKDITYTQIWEKES